MPSPLRLFAVLLMTSTGISVAEADEAGTRDWMKYLEGHWTYEISDGTKGDAVWTLEANGRSSIGRFKEEDTTGIEIGGWRPGTGIGLVNGYDSRGNYWQIEYKSISAKGGHGTIQGRLDGTEYTGEFSATVVNDDQWKWNIEGKTSAGDVLDLSANLQRAKPAVVSEEESDSWLNYFVGDWTREQEISRDGEKTVDTATWNCELAADGKASVCKGKWDQNGATWVMICGWGHDVIHYERGADSTGINWSVDFEKVDDRTLRGRSTGVAEGQAFEGTITLTRTSDDHYVVTWEATLADGDLLKARATNTRGSR